MRPVQVPAQEEHPPVLAKHHQNPGFNCKVSFPGRWEGDGGVPQAITVLRAHWDFCSVFEK